MPTSYSERTRALTDGPLGGGELFVRYLLWHYSRAIIDTLVVSLNLLWFILHYFSIPLHMRTFFSPWRRMHDGYRGRRGVEDYLETLVFNIASRLIGAFIRLLIIISGGVVMAVMLICLIGWFLLWVALPFASVGFLLIGIMLLI